MGETQHGTAPASPAYSAAGSHAVKARPLYGALGLALASVYGAAVGARNRRFDAGKGVTEFDRSVLSVGNLSVGGTGKTPMVMHLLGVLGRAGHRPCVAMRGYRASRTGGSDEAAEYARAFPDVPVIARPDRADGLIDFFATKSGGAVDCIVLDDGFQHRRIARQVDLVIVDGAGHPPSEHLLPAGWLREPAGSIARATHAAVMRTPQSDEHAIDLNARWLESALGAQRVSVCRREWADLRVTQDGAERVEPCGWLAGKRVLAVCAIGKPAQFVAQVSTAAGARAPVPSVVLPDHDAYSERVVERILAAAERARAQAIVVTEKDWSKLSRVDSKRWGRPVVRPRVALHFDRGGEELAADVLATVERVLAETTLEQEGDS